MPEVVRREIVLPVERERAWELLTEPAELREWLADEVELEPEPGAPLRVDWADGEVREGEVEEVEPEPAAALPLGRRHDRRPLPRRVDARRRARRHARHASSSARSCRSSCAACPLHLDPVVGAGVHALAACRPALAGGADAAPGATSTRSSPRSRTRRGGR